MRGSPPCTQIGGSCAHSTLTTPMPTPMQSAVPTTTKDAGDCSCVTGLPDRRSLLQGAAAGGAGVLLGFILGSSQGSVQGVDPTERKEIDELRAEAKFRRDYDGHVFVQIPVVAQVLKMECTRAFVQAKDGSWFEARLDAQIPGTLLLRDPDNFVYFINLNIQQIDLTDDYVVVSIFGDGSWESTLQKVQGKDDNGVLIDARFDQEAFRDLISIME
eukprot:353182-Chlamydomonas_euryale.AAC.42